MELFSQDFIELFKFLIPGFFAAWVYHSLTSYPKPSTLERVIQALIFTVLVQISIVFMKSALLLIGRYLPALPWNSNADLIWSIIISLLIGCCFAFFVNTDKLHQQLRKIGLTRETSFPSVWVGTFIRKRNTYVVLHVGDNKRLCGWLKEWPPDPQSGHFCMEQPEWLTKSGSIKPKNVDSIMLRASDVKMVEFLRKKNLETQMGNNKDNPLPSSQIITNGMNDDPPEQSSRPDPPEAPPSDEPSKS